MNLAVICFQLISIFLTRNTALAIRLRCGVDTTANENSLNRRRTIRTNACTQEKIIEFLSILHYNEFLDISMGWALRTLQSMDNYLVGAESMGQSERERESARASLYWGLKRTLWWWKNLLLRPHIYLLSVFVYGTQTPRNTSLSDKEWMKTPISLYVCLWDYSLVSTCVCLCDFAWTRKSCPKSCYGHHIVFMHNWQ